jgi:hypothetical protein
MVKSQLGNGYYYVNTIELGYGCDLSDYTSSSVQCKHLLAVELSNTIRATVRQEVVIQRIAVNLGHNVSLETSKDSVVEIVADDSQLISGFERMHATTQIITDEMKLYLSEGSFRNVKYFLRLQRIYINHIAVYEWLPKYVQLTHIYLD